MYMGAAEDEGRNADPAVAMAKMQLAKAAGFDTIRITAIWEPGQSAVPAGQLAALQAIAAAGDFLGIRVVTTVMNFGSRTTPLTAAARTQFARFAADIVRRVPSIREYIVGNEPNLNRYWLPQFGPNGEDAAATAYVQLLARTYDAMKAADKGVFIIGGSVSPRGIDRPGTGRDTHSPTAFITDMGTAYRALKRNRPIMDGFSFHPYGESSSTPPTFAHAAGTSLGLADYDKLVGLLGSAFDGTKQLGSQLPIVYDEYGVDSQIPAGKRTFYGGKEPATTKPVSEGVQAAYYREALELGRLSAHGARLPDLPCHGRDRLQPLAIRRLLRGRDPEVIASVRQADDGGDPVRRGGLRRATGRRLEGRLGCRHTRRDRRGGERLGHCRWLGLRGRLGLASL